MARQAALEVREALGVEDRQPLAQLGDGWISSAPQTQHDGLLARGQTGTGL
jgi:hypothetical protein